MDNEMKIYVHERKDFSTPGYTNEVVVFSAGVGIYLTEMTVNYVLVHENPNSCGTTTVLPGYETEVKEMPMEPKLHEMLLQSEDFRKQFAFYIMDCRIQNRDKLTVEDYQKFSSMRVPDPNFKLPTQLTN